MIGTSRRARPRRAIGFLKENDLLLDIPDVGDARMQIGSKEILVVGDRILVKPDNPDERTKVGLYLPQTVVEREPVQAGRVVATGPGVPVPNLSSDYGEPWQEHRHSPMRFIPLQAEVGDYALFLRKEAVEICYKNEQFLVIPQSALLLLIRDNEEGEIPPVEA